jgi:Uma2 family endonuclease
MLRIFSVYLRDKKCKVYHDGRPILIPEEIKTEFQEKFKKEFPAREFPKKYLLPDLVVVCDPEIDKDLYIDGAPTLVIEILSAKTMRFDIGLKKDIYEKIGVKEYWIVEPNGEWIEIFDFQTNTSGEIYKDDTDDDIEFSPINFPDLKISLSDVFKGV